eukprot:EC726570.1.p1 GENE.EC726570.1~~EC726570.1.p1  ORF type:complete len:177 (+),score=21.24 EC726570.1:36-533(+)
MSTEEELESLRAIFPGEVIEVDQDTFALKVPVDGAPSHCMLQWKYVPEYPIKDPPVVYVSAPWLPLDMARLLARSLQQQFDQDLVVYKWILWLQSELVPFLQRHDVSLAPDTPQRAAEAEEGKRVRYSFYYCLLFASGACFVFVLVKKLLSILLRQFFPSYCFIL